MLIGRSVSLIQHIFGGDHLLGFVTLASYSIKVQWYCTMWGKGNCLLGIGSAYGYVSIKYCHNICEQSLCSRGGPWRGRDCRCHQPSDSRYIITIGNGRSWLGKKVGTIDSSDDADAVLKVPGGCSSEQILDDSLCTLRSHENCICAINGAPPLNPTTLRILICWR